MSRAGAAQAGWWKVRIEPGQSGKGWNGQWGRAKIMRASMTSMKPTSRRMTAWMTSVQEAKTTAQEQVKEETVRY